MFRGSNIAGRFAILVFALATFYNFYQFSQFFLRPSGPFNGSGGPVPALEGSNHESLMLNERQCQVAFPLLTKEVDDAVAAGPFQFNRSMDEYLGQTHCKIKNGKVGMTVSDTGIPY